MKKRLFSVALLAILGLFVYVFPVQAAESNFKLNLSFVRQNDGTTSGELWYNDHVIWRLTLLADGAGMVAGRTEQHTTFVAPDFGKGFFLLRIYNQP